MAVSRCEMGVSPCEMAVSHCETGVSQRETGVSQCATGVSQCATAVSRRVQAGGLRTRPTLHLLAHPFPLALPRLDLSRDRLGLQKQAEVVAAAGLRIGAGHVEAAERLYADQRAGAFAVHIQIADEELVLGAADLVRVVAEDRAGEAELRIVGDAQRV